MISLGKKERALLVYMQENKESRLNIKAYSRYSGVPRPTVYYYLDKLVSLKLIYDEEIGNIKDYRITTKGITALEVSDGGVRNLRRECRERSINLSTHYLKYSVPIKDKSRFLESRLAELNPLKIKPLELKNLKQTYLYFDDATIIINPKRIIVRVTDIIAEDTEEAHFKSFNKALKYVEKLEKVGLKGENIELEPSHYARINSLLAGFLEKIDNRYFLDLGNGKKFWIDNSPPNKIEDETNDVEARERLDNFLKAVMNTDSTISDIDKIVNALGFMTKIEAARIQREIRPISQEKDIVPKERPSYFG